MRAWPPCLLGEAYGARRSEYETQFQQELTSYSPGGMAAKRKPLCCFYNCVSYNLGMSWSVIGFEQQKKYTEQLLKQGELPHAFVFSGPEMIGKKLFAQDLYRLANHCETLRDTDPDFTLIAPQVQDGETKIYIDDIRQARGILSLTPARGPYKFLVIDDADRLTAEASNALLKILEEPPSFSV